MYSYNDRIVASKFNNCGQVCIAPDYIYAHKEIMTPLVTELKKQIEAQFSKDPKSSPNYSRLIHKAHAERTQKMLSGHEEKIAAKYGEIDLEGKFFPPTLLIEPDMNSQLMQEEIFGPILPIFAYESPMDVIKFIQKGARPLAVYYYGEPSSIVRQRLEESTHSGAFLVNDSVIHFAINTLPFGGIGDSGYGTTHGRAGKPFIT
jgi:acyl-CoA reductase-like NAD-dependent aldehyde dehydrogenase